MDESSVDTRSQAGRKLGRPKSITPREIVLGLELSPDAEPMGPASLAALLQHHDIGYLSNGGPSLKGIGDMLRDMGTIHLLTRHTVDVRDLGKVRRPGHPPVTWYLSSNVTINDPGFFGQRCMLRGVDRSGDLDRGLVDIEALMEEAREWAQRRDAAGRDTVAGRRSSALAGARDTLDRERVSAISREAIAASRVFGRQYSASSSVDEQEDEADDG